jgi:hypothetical protein
VAAVNRRPDRARRQLSPRHHWRPAAPEHVSVLVATVHARWLFKECAALHDMRPQALTGSALRSRAAYVYVCGVRPIGSDALPWTAFNIESRLRFSIRKPTWATVFGEDDRRLWSVYVHAQRGARVRYGHAERRVCESGHGAVPLVRACAAPRTHKGATSQPDARSLNASRFAACKQGPLTLHLATHDQVTLHLHTTLHKVLSLES